MQEIKDKKVKLIHQYNSLKDASQKLMGQLGIALLIIDLLYLAIIEEETTATMYERYGLEIDD